MNFSSNAVGMTPEILKRKKGGEYIVPVFAKYVALEVDGEIVWHKAVPGAQKKFEFELPEGKSTLLVQCVDYTGRVITQKYPFNAKAAE